MSKSNDGEMAYLKGRKYATESALMVLRECQSELPQSAWDKVLAKKLITHFREELRVLDEELGEPPPHN